MLLLDYGQHEICGKTYLAQSMNETLLTYNGIINVIGLANAGVETLGQTASGPLDHVWFLSVTVTGLLFAAVCDILDELKERDTPQVLALLHLTHELRRLQRFVKAFRIKHSSANDDCGVPIQPRCRCPYGCRHPRKSPQAAVLGHQERVLADRGGPLL